MSSGTPKIVKKGPPRGGGRRAEVPPPDGKVRQSQAITTYGPGAMVDLLHDAVLVGGLEFWGRKGLESFDEPRLHALLERRFPDLRPKDAFVLPPAGDDREASPRCGVQVLEFPRWFVCQNPRCRALVSRGPMAETKAGRYVHDCQEKGSYFVPVRFVMACVNGHIQDFPWHAFVHQQAGCQSPDLQLLEGPTGDFSELVVYCKSCRQRRPMLDATVEAKNFGCAGQRPWLNDKDPDGCDQPLRLLIRTASNSYFPQVVSSLYIPEPKSARTAVDEHWDVLSAATTATLPVFRTIPKVAQALKAFTDAEVLDAITAKVEKRQIKRDPLRTAEFKQFVSATLERAGDYPPPGEDFFIRRLDPKGRLPAEIARVVLAHKLREVRVQTGFTRFESSTPNLQGEYQDGDIGVRVAPLSARVTWLPGVEIRGEGLFIELDEQAVRNWEDRPAVSRRIERLELGHKQWVRRRSGGKQEKEALLPQFKSGRYYLLHSLSHLLIQALSLNCGYSASAIRERIYCGPSPDSPDPTPMAAILLSTGTTGTEGTLGGLLAQGRALGQHLRRAFDLGVLCSNDPVCAAHDPAADPTERNLEGAACHGCLFIAEPSCEQFNGFLDRALVFPTLGHEGVAFFGERP